MEVNIIKEEYQIIPPDKNIITKIIALEESLYHQRLRRFEKEHPEIRLGRKEYKHTIATLPNGKIRILKTEPYIVTQKVLENEKKKEVMNG